MLNERKQVILRGLLKGPRTMQSITASGLLESVAPIHIVRYLNDLVADGFAHNNGRDVFSLTGAGLAELTKPVERTPSRAFCNSTQTALYRSPRWPSAEARGINGRQFESRGLPT